VDIVVNLDIPTHSKDYIHRVGRTARAGRSGKAYTFVSQSVPNFLLFLLAHGCKCNEISMYRIVHSFHDAAVLTCLFAEIT